MLDGRGKGLAWAAGALLLAGAATAAPVGVDGVAAPGEYGAGVRVRHDGGQGDGPGYQVYLNSSEAGFVRGALVADPADGAPAGAFATLFFDLDPTARPGSDLAFVLSPGFQAAFVPGADDGVMLPNVAVAASADGLTLEFAIPVQYLAFPIAGLQYDAGQQFPSHGEGVRLNQVQAFGSGIVDGLDNDGLRLGMAGLALEGEDGVAATDVPEPAAAALLAAGLIGLRAMRRRRMA